MDFIKIENKDYPIKFNLKTFYVFGEKFGLTGIADIFEKISVLMQSAANLTEKDFDLLGNLIHAAISQGCKSEEITMDKSESALIECLYDDFTIINNALVFMTKSMGKFLGEQNPGTQQESPVIEQIG